VAIFGRHSDLDHIVKSALETAETSGSTASDQSAQSGEAVNDVLIETIVEATAWLVSQQADDGHWAFELEADATIPSEYILLNHFLDEIDDEVEGKLAAYLRSTQGDHGGWPLYHEGDIDISATVKAYFALKLTGEDSTAPHMERARDAVLAHGGASKCNVFTRTTLALFGQMPWRAVPIMWVEALLLPKWSPINTYRVSYWSRTVMVPLLAVVALRPVARNPRQVNISELFVTAPDLEWNYFTNPTGHWLGEVMLVMDRILRVLFEPFRPRFLIRHAINKAISFITERLNGVDGLGAIFPAIANTIMAFDALGYSRESTEFTNAREALCRLLILKENIGYCQPCVSPVWDTGLASHALLEAGLSGHDPVSARAGEWLRNRQILDVDGDWSKNRKSLRPGGWAFQYRNDYYPDVDDTAVVVMALDRADGDRYQIAIDRCAEWVIGMQSQNGGWGAFDADNEYRLLEHVPFADHNALLDPPTADVTARCVSMLVQLGYDRSHPAVARGIDFLIRSQDGDGSWFGRWGANYIYGTWSVLCAFEATGGEDLQPLMARSARWLVSRQHSDGGWGEDCSSYWEHRKNEVKKSTPTQTAWALLALMKAGEVENESVRRGVEFLLDAPREGGEWTEKYFNAVGFPRVFYLHYHGYNSYFPLWALARYRALRLGNSPTLTYGM